MQQDETTCLRLFWCSGMRPRLTLWCFRMRPHVSGGSNAAGWDYMSHVVLMRRDETRCLTFWCVGMRPHVSGGSDASEWDHLYQVVLMQRDETTCLMFWCVGMRPHVWLVSLPQCPAIVHITLSSVRLWLSWCEPDYYCTLWNETLLQWFSVLMLPKCICFIHNICPCFLCLFRLFCIIVLMFHNFLQPN
jgi:hypothetical protein